MSIEGGTCTNISSHLIPTDEYTVSTLFRLPALPGSSGSVVATRFFGNDVTIITYGDGRLIVRSLGQSNTAPSGTIKANRWYHLLLSYKNNSHKAWLDGDLLWDEKAGANAFGSWVYNFCFGGGFGTGAAAGPYQLDDLIYSRYGID